MTRAHHYFSHQHARIHYTQTGHGPHILLAFHGYGQDTQALKHLEEALSAHYTIYSFHLFFHGESYWQAKSRGISKAEWNDILNHFLQSQQIQRFSIAGFSMGAKMVLTSLEHCQGRIDKIILMSPDGIKTSFWYSLATLPFFMDTLFRRTVIKPGLYFRLVQIMGTLGIVDKGILKFSTSQMNTRQKRLRLYYTWIVYRHMRFNKKNIAHCINQCGCSLEIFLGKYDKIITYERIHGFLKKLNRYKLHLLSSGHSDLIDAVADYYDHKLHFETSVPSRTGSKSD